MRKRLIRGLLPLALGLAVACAAPADLAPATPLPDSLDLSHTGVVDIDYLQEYTWLKSLDLRGNDVTIDDYAALAAALPDCTIRWSVPVAGGRVDSDARYIRVSSFGEEDIEALAYLPALARVNARGCTDYDALLAASARYGDVTFQWTLRLGAVTAKSDADSLDLSGEALTAEELRAAISCLPALRALRLGGMPLSDAQRRALLADYPNILFSWLIEVLPGVTADSAADTLDLRGHTVTDVDALLEKLALLPGLAILDMCECGPSDADMLRIREALPQVKVVWMIDVGGYRIRTDIKGFSTGVITRFPDGGGYLVGPGGHRQRDGAFDKLVYCTDIVALDIGHCANITDISFIGRLPKLKYLVIAMTGVSDISVLAGQTELEFLEIYDNTGITDITPLKNCAKLKYLNCRATSFTEIETLKSLTKLERLWVTASKLTDEQKAALRAALPNTLIVDSPERTMADSLWRRGNWSYVEMQRIFGMRAQFQGGVTPSPAPAP